MAGLRTDLHTMLVGVMEEFIQLKPERHVFYQPPETVKLTYPCIIYKLSGDLPVHADNLRYRDFRRYQVTLIDRNPDSEIPKAISALRYCAFDRAFTVDNLNHFVFDLYY